MTNLKHSREICATKAIKLIWRLSASTTIWVKLGNTPVEKFCLGWIFFCCFLFFLFFLFLLLHWNKTHLQMCFAKFFSKVVFWLIKLNLIVFYWSFNICIYCKYGNLELLAFIVSLITFFNLVDGFWNVQPKY